MPNLVMNVTKISKDKKDAVLVEICNGKVDTVRKLAVNPAVGCVDSSYRTSLNPVAPPTEVDSVSP